MRLTFHFLEFSFPFRIMYCMGNRKMAFSPQFESEYIRRFAKIVRHGTSANVWNEWTERIHDALTKIGEQKVKNEALERFVRMSNYVSVLSVYLNGIGDELEKFADFISRVNSTTKMKGFLGKLFGREEPWREANQRQQYGLYRKGDLIGPHYEVQALGQRGASESFIWLGIATHTKCAPENFPRRVIV